MYANTRTPDDFYDYQKKAVNFQATHPSSALWMDMGLGKTVITLSSVAHLIGTGYLNAVLVVAPIRVCRLVWRQEAQKWSHLRHLTFTSVIGSRDQRTRALLRPSNIYLINYENLRWLAETLDTYFVKKNKPLPFDGIVWDEISKMKNSATKRVMAVRKILPHIKWKTGLTGTPASNGYKDLHGQYLVLDGGERLGTSKTAFKDRFYYKVSQYREAPYPDTEQTIQRLIGDITLQMSAADYNPLPDLMMNDIMLEMPEDLRTKYEDLEKKFFFELDNGRGIEVFNSAAMTNKVLQFANGAVYPIGGMPLWEPVHDIKLEALEDIIEEASGQPVLCAYAYRSDAERILKHFKTLTPINLTDCKSEKSLSSAMARWQSGDCPLMLGHPASMGHGIDGLQDSGHILVWFGLNWSLDLFDQFNARLRRQGQGVPVVCHRLLMNRTMDMAQRDALESKATTEASLRQAIKSYRDSKGY
jgi:SNF2 family DNA or RNA helicase